MHAELMEFNQHLQKRLQELESGAGLELVDYPESNVKAYIPTAFLVGKKTRSYHVYQVKCAGFYLYFVFSNRKKLKREDIYNLIPTCISKVLVFGTFVSDSARGGFFVFLCTYVCVRFVLLKKIYVSAIH